MSSVVSASGHFISLTICAYRKRGMDEDAYHRYLSEKHAPLLTDLMVENKIIGYTMVRICCSHSYKGNLNIDFTKQHNTGDMKKLMGQMFEELPESRIADYDAFIHIVFKDVQDFINVRNDPYYKQVVVPDHRNFADQERTTMVTGWLETHIVEGKAIAAEPGLKLNGPHRQEVQGAD